MQGFSFVQWSSSRKLEDGTVEITAPVYSSMPVGHRLYLADTYAARSAADRHFEDYLARLALSPLSGPGVGRGHRRQASWRGAARGDRDRPAAGVI